MPRVRGGSRRPRRSPSGTCGRTSGGAPDAPQGRGPSEQEEAIRHSYPEGTAYVGVYGATFTSEKSAGELFWIETFETYSALDSMAAVANDPTSDFHRLLAEMAQFADPDRGAGWSRMLLKNATEASWFDTPLA